MVIVIVQLNKLYFQIPEQVKQIPENFSQHGTLYG